MPHFFDIKKALVHPLFRHGFAKAYFKWNV